MANPNDQEIYLRAKVEQKNHKKLWQADVDRIEALLSLWLRRVQGSEEREQQLARDIKIPETNWLRHKSRKQSILFLGSNTLALRRDLRWWVPSGAAEVLKVGMVSADSVATPDMEPNRYQIDSHRITGFHGPSGLADSHTRNSDCGKGSLFATFQCLPMSLEDMGSHDKPEDPQTPSTEPYNSVSHDSKDEGPYASLGIVTTAPKELLYAQHIFTAFMIAAAEKLDRIGGASKASQETANSRPSAWQHIRLRNTEVSKMALGIQNADLSRSHDEAYTYIIPPLSLENKLPIGAAVDLELQHAAPLENMNWESLQSIYRGILRVTQQFSSKILCPFAVKAAAVVYEYLKRLTNKKEIYSTDDREWKILDAQIDTVKKCLMELMSDDIKATLRLLYDHQSRLDDSFVFFGHERGVGDPNSAHVGFTNLHKKVLKGEDWDPKDGKTYANAQDILGRSPSHYAAVLNDKTNRDRVRLLIQQKRTSEISPIERHFIGQQMLETPAPRSCCWKPMLRRTSTISSKGPLCI
ncbi:hypothetical protein BZA05DRAFT_61625 [Tricharina praecox]|uniref:uncharacterized protein n=1 Tax=Tricharina praecox TaxID=43433 RepID=UPI00221FD5A8|nr:uncharacterized protein BZA05DRAFT_61625 [Tricharina praecox]KAI5850717.1 hypothetical protein BZA05DRAFT_61625 [Tricharina praecox]